MPILITILFFLSGCTTVPVFGMGQARSVTDLERPIDANKYEGLTYVSCDGMEKINQFGTSSCQFKAGDEDDFFVKLPPTSGQVLARSLRYGKVSDFSGESFQTVHWAFPAKPDSDAIVFSVAGHGTGIQLSKIYVYVYTDDSDRLNGTFKYYCADRNSYVSVTGQDACQQQRAERIDGEFYVDPSSAGTYEVISSGCTVSVPSPQLAQFPLGTTSIPFAISYNGTSGCITAFLVKQDNGKRFKSRLNLDFYDDRYVPLSPPAISKQDPYFTACPSSEYDYFEMNDKTKESSIFMPRCRKEKLLPNNTAMGWDSFGRFSMVLEQK